jgi:hypothetical protein
MKLHLEDRLRHLSGEANECPPSKRSAAIISSPLGQYRCDLNE